MLHHQKVFQVDPYRNCILCGTVFKEEKEQKLDINITAVTGGATRVSERLINTILKEGKESLEEGNYVSLHVKEGNMQKELIVHADTITDSAIECYVEKKTCILQSEFKKKQCYQLWTCIHM